MNTGGGIKYPSYWMLFLVVFMLGFAVSKAPVHTSTQVPFSETDSEVSSPGDWINESQVKITSSSIRIDVPNATWARFANTNSMDPVIDEGMNSLEIRPESPKNLDVGDIISYKAKFADGIIIHRIIDIQEDEEGTYYIVKGDNNDIPDPQKVRFDDIQGVVIGILF